MSQVSNSQLTQIPDPDGHCKFLEDVYILLCIFIPPKDTLLKNYSGEQEFTKIEEIK